MSQQSKDLFTTDIIDASRYRRLKPIRYTCYFILLVPIPFVMDLPDGAKFYIGFADMWIPLQPQLFWSWLALGAFTLWLYFYSRMSKFLGEVSINKERIKIKEGEKITIYPFNEITKLKVTRGATFHYDYQKFRVRHFHYVQTINNWISFTTKEGETIKFEFLINSHVQNIYFEDMVKELRGRGYKFDYLSI